MEYLLRQRRGSRIKNFIIMGDFNEDITPKKTTPLKDFIESLGMKQIITQCTTKSATLLDHVYIAPNISHCHGLLPTYFSHHEATFLALCPSRSGKYPYTVLAHSNFFKSTANY